MEASGHQSRRTASRSKHGGNEERSPASGQSRPRNGPVWKCLRRKIVGSPGFEPRTSCTPKPTCAGLESILLSTTWNLMAYQTLLNPVGLCCPLGNFATTKLSYSLRVRYLLA